MSIKTNVELAATLNAILVRLMGDPRSPEEWDVIAGSLRSGANYAAKVAGLKREAASITLATIRGLTGKARQRFFDRATPEQMEAFTAPCVGDAHSNPNIDHCMVCLGIRWGRMLKPLPKESTEP